MKVALIRTPQGFIPDSQHDAEVLEKVHIGDVIYGEFKRPRNLAFHRKAFALLHDIYENADYEWHDFQAFYDWMKWHAGCTREIIGPEGAHITLKSLSFGAMDEEEFSRMFERFKTVAFEKLGMEWVL